MRNLRSPCFSRVHCLASACHVHQQESIGQYESCYRSYYEHKSCRSSNAESCEWDEGYVSCERKIDSQTKVCTGGFHHCKTDAGSTTCTPLADPPAGVQPEYCYTSERFRYWQSMELDVLDLREPGAPKLTPVQFAREEEASGLVASGSSVYFAFKRPHTVSGDDRPFAKHFFREVNLLNPAQPVVSVPVNVPGQLLAVDGARLFTRDLRWGTDAAETWLHVLNRSGDVATLTASQPFSGREVTGAIMDGSSRLFVTHSDLARRNYYGHSSEQALDKLAIFSADGLTKLGETEVDAWSDMTQVVQGRVLFSVPGGMLIVNALDSSAPYAQAYFPYQGYQRKVEYDGQSILVASGPYGVYRMDATTHNLMSN